MTVRILLLLDLIDANTARGQYLLDRDRQNDGRRQYPELSLDTSGAPQGYGFPRARPRCGPMAGGHPVGWTWG